jgi:AcrR family transcriptional regulator
MGTRERRRREADQRRREILEAARRLFWRQGYAGTSIPQIARAAELAPGTIYLYFPSKEALYAELGLQGYDLLRQRLAEEARRPALPPEKAESLLDVFFGFAREYPEYYDIIFFLIQRERSGGWEGIFPEEAIARVRIQENLCRAIAAQILEDAGFRDERRRAETVDAVWSMLAGVIFHFGRDPAGARITARAKELILAAIFAAKARQ